MPQRPESAVPQDHVSNHPLDSSDAAGDQAYQESLVAFINAVGTVKGGRPQVEDAHGVPTAPDLPNGLSRS